MAGTARAQFTNSDFESGNFTNWTVTGDGWSVVGADFTGSGSGTKQGTYFATTNPNESLVGTLRSPNFTPLATAAGLDFLIAGHNHYPGKNSDNSWNYVSVKKASNNSEVARIYAPGSDAFTAKEIDLSSYIGQSLYIEVVDDSADTGFAWVAVDDFKMVKVATTRLVYDDFESGSFDTNKWTVTGNWEVVASGQGFGNAPTQGTYAAKTSYDKVNNASSDALVGTLTSKPISVYYQDTYLKFDLCGHDGPDKNAPAGQNHVEIYLSTNMTTPVATILPPFADAFSTMKFDLSPYRNQKIVIKFIDSRTDGFGWIGIDDVKVEYDATIVPVELSSFNAE